MAAAGEEPAETEPTVERRDPQASLAARPLLFLLDTWISGLEGLRDTVAETAADGGSEADSDGRGLAATLKLLAEHIVHAPQIAAGHYARFAAEVLRILEGESDLSAEARDFRFKDRLWMQSPFLRTLLQLYLALERALDDWLGEQRLDRDDRRRIDFLFEQLIAALAPSNLPLNPAALRRAKATEGRSLIDGIRNLLDDAVHNRGMPRQISRNAYAVGVDLAVTPGAVVYRNEQLELIQYAPQTDCVRRRPVLLIPPQINKFYCFDLRPQNSLIGHLVGSGVQLFTLSWRNPSADQAHWDLDTYVAATLQAMDAVAAITRSRTLGLISACAGGLTAMAAIGYLAARGERRVAHHSLLVTCLLPGYGSKLELFVTPRLIESARRHAQVHGVMEGDALAKLFAWLRPTDLVWRYWINNYLLGKSPPPLDILFWDNDSTRLPAGLHADFLDMYAKDVFRQPGRLQVLGERIDFRRTGTDTYFVAGEDDYLMPWEGCFEAAQILGGRHHFVLSTSGHVQSILRPPRLANTHYLAAPATADAPSEWRASAVRHEGSWWCHWQAWLNARSGGLKAAPQRAGCAEYPPLAAAPGSYVFG